MELLVVIALISLLAAMAVVQYRNSIQRTQEATLKTNLFRMRDAIDQYYADKGKYPSSLDALVSDQYLRRIPEDPFTKSADTLADGAGGTGSGEPVSRTRHLRREERRAGPVARRHDLRGLVVSSSQLSALSSQLSARSRSAVGFAMQTCLR